MKSIDIRLPVYRVICLAVKFHGHSFAAQASIMQGLQFFEHLAEPMAELVSKLATEFDHAQLGDGLVKEIASKNFSAQDSKGPRVFSKFLVKYTEEAPKSVLKQLSLLKGQFDSEVRSRFPSFENGNVLITVHTASCSRTPCASLWSKLSVSLSASSLVRETPWTT